MWKTMNEFKSECLLFEPVGSWVTCNPPPMDTDKDFLAQVKNFSAACGTLQRLGFETTTDSEYEGMSESNFISYRRGITNIIVSPDADFIQAFMAATHVAKELNLLRKEDRIMLFQAVLYRRPWPPKPILLEEVGL